MSVTVCPRNARTAMYAGRVALSHVKHVPRALLRLEKVEMMITSHCLSCLRDIVYGCPDAEALEQPGYWYKRHGNQLEVGCTTGNDRWRLTCDGFNWIGESHRNCSIAGDVLSVKLCDDVVNPFQLSVPEIPTLIQRIEVRRQAG